MVPFDGFTSASYTRSAPPGTGGYITYRLGLIPDGTTNSESLDVTRYGSVLQLKKGGVVGIRFRGVDIPPGATVNEARVVLTAHDASDDKTLVMGVQAVGA